MTFAILSDIHAHAWTVFGKPGPDGVNNRLSIILAEIERAADELVLRNGDTMVIAGDILHTRGTIDPEVLNPLRACFERVLSRGITVLAIPGNHDLKSAETSELASAIQNLEQIGVSGGSFTVFNKTTALAQPDGSTFLMVPWHNTQAGLLAALQDVVDNWGLDLAKTDVFIHAGIDGVLSNMPAHGMNHVKLGAFGFRRVFSGHYHNHKDFGNGVVSIGATTHQNWGDVGTRAGFILADAGKIEFMPAQSPSFIDISALQPTDWPMVAGGNYVRYRGASMTGDQVVELRQHLHDMGALGVSVEAPRASSVSRSTAVHQARTTEESIDAFVRDVPPADPAVKIEDVVRRSIEILNESQAVAA
ncbi:metallophosphoesterase family protein [Paracoccus litorisediminis]|uniref:Calcineurin-like phosphoesterase domain-containing protein n=1 Tax=Paracoccus litorisediminis TaxID=2006130 RepID=A0A844HRP7_9RHOB|nr:metallophosphoesterase [Paracoccus litorisediminis]MTH61104.1 hypothetical protein [Paracoccus litorisediminis]